MLPMSVQDEEEMREAQIARYERARNLSQPYIDRAARAYAQSLNGLWIGNAGAAITLIGVMGGLAKDRPEIVRHLAYPLSSFVLGLVAMGAGAFVSLIQQARLARRMEDAPNLWDIRVNDIKRPSEEIGLSFRDWRTIAGCVAAVLFVAGCFLSLIDLFVMNR